VEHNQETKEDLHSLSESGNGKERTKHGILLHRYIRAVVKSATLALISSRNAERGNNCMSTHCEVTALHEINVVILVKLATRCATATRFGSTKRVVHV
jgi:hypothetical protein